ncbi:MAG: hypothetical protein B6D35_02115 [Candidatus Brocadia sp. UTAMX2]|jgi:hypothetical protein|nr:MAG: hypothetical protein B6D35_02115 [Candidatus Brocadia sp. UTAMX2]
MMKYYKNSVGINLIFIVCCFSATKLSACLADEKRNIEPMVHGVMIVSLDAPMMASIGEKIPVVVVIGNERMTKETTILTVTCSTMKQIIGREAETLDGLSSKKFTYTWNTKGLKEDAYTIRAEIEKIPRETYIDDNVKEAKIYLVP